MMNVARLLAFVLLPVAVAAAQNPFRSSQPGYPKWSPFSDVKWQGDDPWVEIDGKWFALESIHGVSINEILDHAKVQGWNVRHRFAEDLVQMLRLMGKKIDRTTDLQLRDESGKRHVMKSVQMTEANLRSVMVKARFRANPFLSSAPGYPDWSPWEDVRWKAGQPSVKVKGTWYIPVSIHGIGVDEILQHSRQQNWETEKRFHEDIVQMIRLMGHKIGDKTDLVLRDADGNEVMLNDFVMGRRRGGSRSSRNSFALTQAEANEDIDTFQHSLEEQFAYLLANDFDYKSALADVKLAMGDGIQSQELAVRLQQVMMGFIDGHASVPIPGDQEDSHLPFAVVKAAKGYVAIKGDRSAFFDPEYPYIESIAGVSIDDLLIKTEPWIAKGSSQMVGRRGLEMLGAISRFLPAPTTGNKINVELSSKNGQAKKAQITLRDSHSRLEDRTEMANGIIKRNIGYLRLPRMNSRATESIDAWMPKFRHTRGLIIDVRDNGGGIRTPILALAKFLMSPNDEPRIGNVAKYRLAAEFEPDHLSRARYVYTIDSPRFDDRSRKVIEQFAKTFKPQWNPPDDLFSPWHYLVLSKSKSDPQFRYDKPVKILMDGGCFSATDIFLGTFKDWPGVTLMGQPSGGGSARSQSFRLPNSGISVRCASMASFQPNGKLYDTNGVQPDVVVTLPADYFLRDGQDVMLDRAVQAIAENRTQ